AVFNESNGYVSVWHLGDVVRDEVGTLESEDKGTSLTAGMIGKARYFPGKAGVFGGEEIPNYPSGGSAHTTSLWFRAEQPNGTIIGWGNEGGGRGSKVRMQFRSPPQVHIDSDFSDIKGESRLPMNEWVHVTHVFGEDPRRLYINGRLDAEATTTLDIKTPSRLWLGGWYHNYDFIGDLDEVRIANVARTADWVRLEFENQKPLQTLVGPLVKSDAFAVTPEKATVDEGQRVDFIAKAEGALKLYWTLNNEDGESLVAVDRFAFTLEAGRVTGDKEVSLQCKAVYPDGVRTKDIAISIKEAIPDPVFALAAPKKWDGRSTIEVVSQVTNLSAMQAAGASDLKTEWSAGPFAVIKEIAQGKLILKRAQNSGKLTVTATISNGGKAITQSVTIEVTEPANDAWVMWTPGKEEKPLEGQFYARDEEGEGEGEGTLHYKGTLTEADDSVFLKLYADDQLVKTETANVGADKSYALSTKLKPGLIIYKVEFGVGNTVLETVGDLVCGDAYLIDGQSNALATDTGEKSPPETSEWIRSYGRAPGNANDDPGNLWCRPVWKVQDGEKAELGWWGMELAKRLVTSQKMPIFIVNAAAGGTRIDQHQRNLEDPTDLTTIYGRMLWRVQQAKLTHGIRGILWHQGENDQGAAGPTGSYGWESYQQLFVEMAGGWKQDFPNVQRYYVFQIWPNSCSMGGREGSGDRLREKQRTLPKLFSNMAVMSTLGIQPGGPCHYPLEGWSEFARLIQPLLERDFYGNDPAADITPANLQSASFTGDAKDKIALEFDQPVVWDDSLVGQFYLDGAKDKIASGSIVGNTLTLKLKEATKAKTITYLKEIEWSQDTLLRGANGIAALTFCEVPLAEEDAEFSALQADAKHAFAQGVTPFVKDYCTKCHGNRRSKGGLNFEAALKSPGDTASSQQWKQALANVKAYDMPPDDEDKLPTDEERQKFEEWIGKIKFLSPKDPGLFVIRRLTKVEYGNTLHDLFGVDPDIADELPDEVFGEGYLNALSPLQSEQFLGIANEVLNQEWKLEVQKRLFGEMIAPGTDLRAAAKDVARSLARKAYRRPPSEGELDVLLQVFDLARENDLAYTAALRLMLKAVLVSPQFLYITPASEVEPGRTIVSLDDHQLASRLSYLLWSTMPDAELSALADSGKLHEPAVLKSQVKRMVQHERSRALFDGFGAQWLGVGDLETKTFDPDKFPQMTNEMRLSMYNEVRLFFESIMRGNQSVVRFVDSDYTFLNGALATLYGMEQSVTGSEMRKVTLTDANRGGILGMPGVLATTSFPNRTSPVKRGVWVLEQVLGEHVPPAPPNVPALEKQNPTEVENLTLRQRTELHQTNATCANCHKILDPIGFGLENFDAIGRWREQDDAGGAIDAAGELPGGEHFTSPHELKAIIAARKYDLARNLTEKLLAYVLCRQLEGYDEIVVDHLMETIENDGYRMQTLISEIVTSYPFTHRRLQE
ncbi:MAG: hypothetical protein ACI8T1_005060, partial [Verrucomicrobiales bacterium]